MFGVDFSETFAPVERLDTIRMLLALIEHKRWKVYHLDVKFVFLNGYLQEEIYVEQPEGWRYSTCFKTLLKEPLEAFLKFSSYSSLADLASISFSVS